MKSPPDIKSPSFDKWRCLECRAPVADFYMVHDDIWNQAAEEQDRKGMLHLRCLSIRLSRSVTSADLTSAECNDQHRWFAATG